MADKKKGKKRRFCVRIVAEEFFYVMAYDEHEAYLRAMDKLDDMTCNEDARYDDYDVDRVTPVVTRKKRLQASKR